MEKIFTELGIQIIIASFLGVIARILKQPLVIAYIFAGFIMGPAFFGIAQNKELTSLFSTIGIAFLLFIVGLELSTKKIKEAGKKVVFIGMIQMFVVALLGYALSLALGFDYLPSIYIGGLLSFSSTVIVVNLLTEKRAVSTLYGRVTIGILILQDVVALLVLVFLSGLGANSTMSILPLIFIFSKGLLAFLVAYLVSKYVIGSIFKYLAHSLDILFLASIAWCFAIAGIFSYLGFSIEMGAFIAGVTLANLPYAEEIALKLSPLRDFFLILFFITLGFQINWGGLSGIILPIIILSFFVIFIKSLVIMVASGSMGFSKRTSFYSALSLSQVSEFSLIIAMMGLSYGHIDKNVSSIIIMVTVVTILTSSYLITFLGNIYNTLRGPLSLLKMKEDEKERDVSALNNHIILFGYHRLAKYIFKSLEKITKKIAIVDIDPEVIEGLICKGKYCVYGDAYDPDLLERLNIEKAQMIVSTFSGTRSNRFLIRRIRSVNKSAKIIIVAEHSEDAIYLYKSGADYVVLPHHISGAHVAEMIEKIRKQKNGFARLKKKHISSLKKYKKLSY